MVTTVILLLVLLQLKHLIIDWCLQPAFEYLNKGTYGHWGGIRHALKNAIGTMLCFAVFVHAPMILFWVFLFDFLAHYHIDYLKMNINRIKGWGPTTCENFWRLIGLDQCLHQLTYLGLVALFFI